MTSLFKLIEAASIVIVNGYEIDEFVWDVPGQVRMGCSDDFTVYLPDQEVDLDSDGEAIAKDEQGDPMDFEFKIIRPLKLTDF